MKNETLKLRSEPRQSLEPRPHWGAGACGLCRVWAEPRAFFFCFLAAIVVFSGVTEAAEYEYRTCHKVVMTRTRSVQENGSVVSVWRADTCLGNVDDELNFLANSYAALYGTPLKNLSRAEGANSRLDIGIAYSRTGTSWLSFMVSARESLPGGLYVARDVVDSALPRIKAVREQIFNHTGSVLLS